MVELLKLLDSILVFGKKLTKHHKHKIKSVIKFQNMELINWIHVHKYYPLEHINWTERKWSNGINEYTESEIYNLYLKDNMYF